MLKKKIVTLLLSLLEGESDADIVYRMSISLDFAILKDRLLVVMKDFAAKQLRLKIDPQDLSLVSVNLYKG